MVVIAELCCWEENFGTWLDEKPSPSLNTPQIVHTADGVISFPISSVEDPANDARVLNHQS